MLELKSKLASAESSLIEVESKLLGQEAFQQLKSEFEQVINSNNHGKRLTDWFQRSNKLESNLKLTTRKLNAAIESCERVELKCLKQEQLIDHLQEELDQIYVSHDLKEMEWETQLLELETIISNYEEEKNHILESENTAEVIIFEQFLKEIPDKGIPINNQLDIAIKNLKSTFMSRKVIKGKYEELEKRYNSVCMELKVFMIKLGCKNKN